jgi:regulator of RNase E activity RraB
MVEFYEMSDDEDVPFRCEVELDLVGDAPLEEKPWLLWFFVKCDEPQGEPFRAFREDLENTLSASLNVSFAGALIKEGWIEFYFYAPSPKRFENLTSEVLARHGNYPYERGSSRDSKWEMYLERLYPDGYASLRIQNRRTIESLAEAGDDLSLAREVEHYLFFQTKSAMDRAVTFLSAHGFELKESVKDEESDYAYGAVLTKIESITPEEIEETTALLYDTSLQEHGHYEGWSTVLA